MGALDYLGAVTPPTRQIAAEVVAHLNKIGKPLPVYPDMGSQVIWGYNAGGAEHGTGRALDFMVQSPANGVGDAVADYVWANRTRFGLIHIIWRQRIRSTRTNPGQWRLMADRGSPTENHMDHPHCYFDGRTLGGSAVTTGGSASTGAVVLPGVKYTVKQVQELVGVTVDGIAGPATVAAIKEIQSTLDLTADGVVGPATEAAMASIIEKIDALAADVKQVKSDVRHMPKRVWSHRIDTPGSIKKEFTSVNGSYSAGGLMAYNLIDFYLKGRSDKILEALDELDTDGS